MKSKLLSTDGNRTFVLGLADPSVRGGHLVAGEVWPTLEVVITEMPAHLRKTPRPDIGLALIELSGSSEP